MAIHMLTMQDLRCADSRPGRTARAPDGRPCLQTVVDHCRARTTPERGA